MDPKAGDSHLLDELLGIDRRAFEEDERTQVLIRDVDVDGGALEDESPTLAIPEVAPVPASAPAKAFKRSAPPPKPVTPKPAAVTYEEEPPLLVESASAETAEELEPDEDDSAEATQRKEALKAPAAAAAIDSQREDDALIGELVDGRYRVLSVLGIGGIGIVYLCRHELLEKPVAMKVLRSEYVLHDDLNERFLNEARAASAIKSPRIVDTLDVGTLPNGAPYFVMEYVQGETLAALLDREGAVAVPRALNVARQIAEGLEAAHAAGVVHRDLKPENVFLALQPEGDLFAKIFDFGIAKVARARKRLTYAGAVFGTPHYMSPEQARGEAVDARSDLYALGVMLFEMVTGTVPFDGEDPLAVMSQHVDRAPPLMASVTGFPLPARLERLVARCLAKDPAHRYSSASEIVADLIAIEADPDAVEHPLQIPVLPALTPIDRLPSSPVAAARVPTLHAHVVPAGAPARLNRGRVLGLAAGAALLLGGLAWFVARGSIARSNGDSPAGATTVLAANGGEPRIGTSSEPSMDVVEVHFVLSPIDAHLFRGEEDLGPMPVSVFVPRGQPMALTVRRKGYITRKVTVDGSETRVVVGMMHMEAPSHPAGVARKK